MNRVKALVVIIFVIGGIAACGFGGRKRFVIAESKSYEASLFRQNCTICHGPEGDGRTLADGTVVPSLRGGDQKARTEAEIYHQIAAGGNGMVPFRGQLTDGEIRKMALFVRNDLRGGE
ncbi:MAG TPA: hypothetical protein DEA22_08370 [Blastocatellia bacterium]|nr:hypothetical protein [Blastocatellia bacterium]